MTGHIASITDVPIPSRMQKLRRDARGYPVPAGVLIDSDGRPHFTVNDTSIHLRLVMEDRCGICGTKLMKNRWFVGGALSAFAEDGMYIDPPMHGECARYALQVCPYLAAPSYARRIDDRTVDYSKVPGHSGFKDMTVIPNRPDPFVAVMAPGQRYTVGRDGAARLKPIRPYLRIEFWSNGRELPLEEAGPKVAEYLNQFDVALAK